MVDLSWEYNLWRLQRRFLQSIEEFCETFPFFEYTLWDAVLDRFWIDFNLMFDQFSAPLAQNIELRIGAFYDNI